MGAQAIFTADGEVYAHELLFRGDELQSAALKTPADHLRATAHVLTALHGDFSVPELIEGRQVFINTPRELWTGHVPLPIAAGGVVLELLETVDVDAELVQGLHQRREHGFAIAIDDYDGEDSREGPLRLAQFVKIDLEVSRRRLSEVLLTARSVNPHAAVVVERIETVDDFQMCQEMGVEYYQGYFLQRPTLLLGSGSLVSRRTCLQLREALEQEQTPTADLVSILRQDPVLQAKLLAAAAAGLGLGAGSVVTLEELVDAQVRQQMSSWATLLLLAGLAT